MAPSPASRRTASQLELEVDLRRPCFSTVPRAASQRTASVLIADEPRTRGRKATLGGSRSRLRSRDGVAPEVIVADIPKVASTNAEKPN